MKFAVDAFKPASVDMRVTLRCGDARVAQHFLNMAKIDASCNQVRGKAMPECVRPDV